jgi:hypothetical protein
VGTASRLWEGKKERGCFENLAVYEIENDVEQIKWGGSEGGEREGLWTCSG